MRLPVTTTRWVVWSLVAGLAAIYGGWRYRIVENRQADELLALVRTAALAMPVEAIATLRGEREDEQRSAYALLRARLSGVRATVPGVRFAYVFRYRAGSGDVVFLADSEAADSELHSWPGDVYEEAATSPGLQRILQTGEASFEGPLRDEFGEWVTAYAVVEGTGAPDVLGIDVAAGAWRWALWREALEGGGIVALVGAALLGVLAWRRRRGQWAGELNKLVQALEQSRSAILIVGLDRRIQYANQGLCQQLGYGREELLGRDWREFKTGETSEELLGEMMRQVRAGHSWEGAWTNRRSDGTCYPVRGHISPVRGEQGELTGFIAVFDDMTTLLRREQELRAARDRAEAGERAKGQFLATMSHEVRTPLNGIVGYAQLLAETPLTEEQRDYLATIRVSTESLMQLVSQVLDHARMEAGGVPLEVRPTNPTEVLEEVMELFAARAAEKGVQLLPWVDPLVPQMVLTDQGRLRQILLNLVGNAVKFTAEGSITMELKAQAGVKAGETGRLRFSVRDTGPGIAEENMSRLFKPFSQIEAGPARRHEGTGLGLVISRNLARALGGDVTVTSAPGEGSVFTCEIVAQVQTVARPVNMVGRTLALVAPTPELRAGLARTVEAWGAQVVQVGLHELAATKFDAALVELGPMVIVEVQAQGLPERRWAPEKVCGLVPVDFDGRQRSLLRPRFRTLLNLPWRSHEMGELLHLAMTRVPEPASAETSLGLHVLVVEDNRVNQMLLQRVLGRCGCTWSLADDGAEAVAELSQTPNIDVVLMDLHMPGVDGWEATRRIRAGEAGEAMRDVWIAAVTADGEPEQRERAEEVGVNDFVLKPVGVPEVLALLQRFLDVRRRDRVEA